MSQELRCTPKNEPIIRMWVALGLEVEYADVGKDNWTEFANAIWFDHEPQINYLYRFRVKPE